MMPLGYLTRNEPIHPTSDAFAPAYIDTSLPTTRQFGKSTFARKNRKLFRATSAPASFHSPSQAKEMGSSAIFSDSTNFCSSSNAKCAVEPTSKIEADAGAAHIAEVVQEEGVSIFRSNVEAPQSSIYEDSDGEDDLSSMLSLKRANPVYDSEDDDELAALESPFKRLRHGGSDDSYDCREFDETCEREDEDAVERTMPVVESSRVLYYNPESMWIKSKSSATETDGAALYWADSVDESETEGFTIPLPLTVSSSVISTE